MKILFISTLLAGLLFSSCNNTDNKNNTADNTDTAHKEQTTNNTTAGAASINGLVSHYLDLKNALTNDNGIEAAAHGKALIEAIDKVDKESLSADQKKVFEDAAGDAKEMAEHIGDNAGKIEHQREHFDMLSNDMYDLVKAFGSGGQTLYKDFCPMYNSNKGAFWLSETKEIKNPYLGKKMPTCGQVKEEIK